ncbi:MAG: hypothetical protein K1X82_01990 [Bacteroidia bacterium]|nr:hypothetical protein [Bacteroidia bacterium]
MPRLLLWLLCFLFFSLRADAQLNQIDTLKIRLVSSFADNSEAVLNFPKFILKKKSMENKVNMELKEQITGREFEGKAIDQSYRDWAQYFSSIGFEVFLNQNQWVSLEVYGEFCGAYCSSFNQYHTVNLANGKFYTIEELVDTTGFLRELIYSRLDSTYQASVAEVRSRYKLDTLQTDSSYLPIIMEELENCRNDFKIQAYSLTPTHFIIRKNCEFPHFMHNEGPFWELRFSWQEIKSYLKPQLTLWNP